MKINTRVILMAVVIASAFIAVSAAAYPQWGTFSPITPDTNPFVEQDVSMARYFTEQGDFNSAQDFITQAKGQLPYDPEVNAAEAELQEAETAAEAPVEEPVEEVTEETTEEVVAEEIVIEETTPTPTEEPTPEV